MRLSDFIRQNRPSIIKEWQDFARTLRPSLDLTQLQLTDHIDSILTFVADDIESAQTAGEQLAKSRGRQIDRSPGEDTAAQTHAALRRQDGFDMVEMVSEYRALRATVTSLWGRGHNTFGTEDLMDLGRFHEAIDQALAESVERFTEDVDKAKGLLLGVLGHDIRSPVAAIQMVADMVPRAGPLNHAQSRLVKQIKQCTDRVQHIVADLIDLAKSGAGQSLPLKKARCSLSAVCDQMVGEIRVRHQDREIVTVVPGGIEGDWDEIRLGQLLGNLLANAVQYGDPDAPVVVHLADEGADIVMAVTNGGKPIPKTHLDAIFRSFTRVDAVGEGQQTQASNLGLGLFISKEIATAHGGTIAVVSEEAKGTTFSVRLPKVNTAPH